MNNRRTNAAFLAVALLSICLGWCSFAPAADPSGKPQADADARVAALIEQLGDDDFAVRQRAQAVLSRMGLEAFDALVGAQNHPVMEVQMRSRFLVRGMSVRWFDEADPPEVARVLKAYGEQSPEERASRMDRLANMEDIPGLTALVRLARYEVDPLLSKYAAILILRRAEPATPALKAQTVATIHQGLGTSKRPAIQWLQIYGRTLSDPASTVADWQAAIDKENVLLAEQPTLTSRALVRDLYRWQIKLLQQLHREPEAIALMRQTIELLDGDPAQVTEIVDWLIHRQAWAVVLEVGDRFPHIIADDALLLYLRAQAFVALGKEDKAAEMAKAALQLRSMNTEEHLRVAALLGDRGLFDYAEQEYREVMKTAAAGSVADFKARFQLSEQLHDQGRELQAAESLQPAIDLMYPEGDDAKGEVARDIAIRARRDPDSVRSRMHYFYSRHFHEQKDFAKEKASLSKAIESDPTDADVLIGQFRLPNLNQGERQEVIDQIDMTVKEFRDQVSESRDNAQEAPNEQMRSQYNLQLAMSCNQLAWLVSNTRGDFDEALKCSQKSLEVRPDEGGYWDTLGRCHYAKGDYENAVKTQTQAVKLQPHSGQIRRQLAFFEEALAKQRAAAKQ
ncbi:tetratricopeptide repeat protein [Anatilimnocola sp. NA78]|uniref:tetratricopeptide repeat protein n=1 Tax=Anatilimnocola sp. NA78 TaxID=3415683 RepID=UPI003CE55BE8